MNKSNGYRIGVDVGGTFTDVILIQNNTGNVSVTKILNRDDKRADAVIEGIDRLLLLKGIEADQINWIGHGTTISTNAVIERKGAKTALITNKNFRDILEIGRFSRPPELIYRTHVNKPSPLVPRYLRLGVSCRINRDGKVSSSVDDGELQNAISLIKAENVESVAVCFLFSFLNPIHENQVRIELKNVLPHLEIVLSSEINREFREYPRTSTTVFAAYVAPVLRRYISGLRDKLRNNGVNCPLYIFQSNGGVAEPDIVMRNPALTLLSGPAGAVIGATQICGQAGYKNLITMDIGGTSLDVCLVQNSKADLSTSREIDKFPISTPMLDVHTVGAGGGSIIRTDEVGRIKVGPESMGAHPGPACYGFGGDQPTLTDVNLLMGLLDPSSFANGEVQLDEKRSEEVIREKISKPLGIDLYSAIVGIYRVVTNQISEEIRTITMEQGRDPRDYALVAFGGGGPLHAAGVARELGIGKVIIPKYPGLFSARGIATADFSHDYVRSIVQPLEEIKEKNIASIFSEMITHANLDLEKEGIESNRRDISCSLDMRYIGQTTEVNVPLGKYDEDWKAKFDQAPSQFHKIHEQLYTYSVPNEPIELVNIRVFSIGLLEKPSTRSIESTSSIASSKNSRLVLLPGEKTQIQVPVFKRENLKIGSKLFGPAIVEESSSSTLLLDEMEIIIDAYENMIINLEPSGISL